MEFIPPESVSFVLKVYGYTFNIYTAFLQEAN